MRRFYLRFPRAYRLKPVGQREEGAPSLLKIGASNRGVLVPHSPELEYVVASKGGMALPIESPDFRVETLGALVSLWARLRLAFFSKRKKYVKCDEFSLFSVGCQKSSASASPGFIRMGQSLASRSIATSPPSIQSFCMDGRRKSVRRLKPCFLSRTRRAAVVAHIYYEDTWSDIAGALRSLTIPFDLIVTTVEGREGLIEKIGAPIRGPKLRSWRIAAATSAHSSRCWRGEGSMATATSARSTGRNRSTPAARPSWGTCGGGGCCLTSWARRAPHAAIDMFERDPSIGMIGPKAFRLPKASYPEELSWSANRPMTLTIAERMGVSADKFQTRFLWRDDVLDSPGGAEAVERPPARRRHAAPSADWSTGTSPMRLSACCQPQFWQRVTDSPTAMVVMGRKRTKDHPGLRIRPGPARSPRQLAGEVARAKFAPRCCGAVRCGAPASPQSPGSPLAPANRSRTD